MLQKGGGAMRAIFACFPIGYVCVLITAYMLPIPALAIYVAIVLLGQGWGLFCRIYRHICGRCDGVFPFLLYILRCIDIRTHAFR